MTTEPEQIINIITPQSPDRQGPAIASFVLGVLNLLTWCIPVIGFFMAVAGIVTGIFGIKSSKRGFAVAGIVLSAIGLILSLIAFGLLIFGIVNWDSVNSWYHWNY